MQAAYYPVCLDLRGRTCLVVGGGTVAERKVRGLRACGARVRVVASRLTRALEEARSRGLIDHAGEVYAGGHLEGVFLVIAATDREGVNAAVCRDARQRGIPVNVVDDPDRCDFVLPSVLRRGSLAVAVSTGGASPALAKRVRKDLEALFGPEYALFLRVLGELRNRILRRGQPSRENRRIFEALVASDLLASLRDGHWEQARETVCRIAGEELPIGPSWTP